MSRSFFNGRVELRPGDCLEVLRGMPAESVDSIVTDPPYGLGQEPDALAMLRAWLDAGRMEVKGKGFMGRDWDAFVPQPEVWREAFRVLKPGGHVAAFFGTRTYDVGTLAIRLAGFEIRDQLAWAYGTGFPKSLDVSKAIDKAAGAERAKVRVAPRAATSGTMAGASDTRPWIEKSRERGFHEVDGDEPATEAAKQWQGWGTALKPAWEPICLARKPLIGTVAENVLRHGTGALNIDACRVGDEQTTTVRNGNSGGEKFGRDNRVGAWVNPPGRHPANLVHDGSSEVVEAFPDAPGQQRAVGPEFGAKDSVNCYGDYGPRGVTPPRGDSGSAARFFYSAKADSDDRLGSKHPTVKPVDLMQWLCRLITPPGGVVLDCFAGTGTTGAAAFREGFSAILIEREPEYQADIARRMALELAGRDERKREALKASGRVEAPVPLFGGLAE